MVYEVYQSSFTLIMYCAGYSRSVIFLNSSMVSFCMMLLSVFEFVRDDRYDSVMEETIFNDGGCSFVIEMSEFIGQLNLNALGCTKKLVFFWPIGGRTGDPT